VDNNSVRNQMRKIGYAPVSTPTQNLDRQIAALRSEGCHQIFREKAIDALANRDVLVVAEWDRATRSMPHHRAHPCPRRPDQGAGQAASRPHHAIGRGFIAFLSALA